MADRRINLILSALLGVIIIFVGTLGYSLLEGWSPLDSLYMTVITIATIGYGEIRPLSPVGRVFTIFVIVFGVGNAAYLVGQLTRAMVEGTVRTVLGRRKLERQIKTIKNHYIVCGYGRIGQMIAQEITAQKRPLVIIESDPGVVEQIDAAGHLYIHGEATDEDKLLAAGLKRARALIAVVSSDADNVYIVLSARDLNPDLFILSRASEERSIQKLYRAGANKVVSPYLIGARKMAQVLLRPAIADFIETTVHGGEGITLAMEEIRVTPQSQLKDVTLLESNIRRDLDLIVIAIKTAGGEMIFNPSAQARFQIGDTLIAVGQRESMDRLAQILGADAVSAP